MKKVIDYTKSFLILGGLMFCYNVFTTDKAYNIQIVYGGVGGGELIPPEVMVTSSPSTLSSFKNSRVTQNFLETKFAYMYPAGFHVGTDLVIGKGFGEDVPSLIEGKVVYAENGCAPDNSRNCGLGYGNMIVIQNDTVQVRYAHGFDTKVTEGSSVSAGQVIQRQSNSGASTGTHVHIECRAYGLYVDCFNYQEKRQEYISAAISACETFVGDRKHVRTKELIREHCRSFYNIAAASNQNFFELIGLGHAETNWCTNPNAKIPDNNCYGWAVYGAMDDPRMYCGSWENCFSKVANNFKILEEEKKFFISQKLLKYTPGNVAGHSKNINWGVKELLKEYKKNLKI